MKARKRRNIALSGALVLALAGIFVKVIGLVYKIPLTNLIKSEGMGYFNSAYTIYTFFYMLSSAGLPVAISLLVSRARSVGNRPRVRRILLAAGVLFTSLGTIGSLTMYFFAEPFARLLGNPPAASSIRAIAPTLLFVCVISVLRGYFQGHQYMLPTAVSQIVEALGKLVLGMFFAYTAIKLSKGYESAATGAALGLSIGMGLALLYLLIHVPFFKSERYYEEIYDTMPPGSFSSVMKELLKASLPITISASVLSMTNTLDLALVMRSLCNIGMSAEAANAAYGNYTALAVPLFNLPIVFITPIANTVVPYIAGSVSASRDTSTAFAISSALRMTALIAFPCSLGLCALSGPILQLLFDDTLALAAAPLLETLSPSVIFLSLATVTSALLQALGRPTVPVVSMVVGATVKALCCPMLIKCFSIKGAPMSTFLCYFIVCVINFIFLAVTVKKRPRFFTILLRPLFCALACALTCKLSYLALAPRFGNTLSCLAAIAVAVTVYILLVLLGGYITEDELRMLPKGNKLVKIIGSFKKTKGNKNERNRDTEIKGRTPYRRPR